MSQRRVADWLAEARTATLPPLRFPPPAPLFPHQELGARRLVFLLSRYGGALLLDGVGMGKSFTAAAAARELNRAGWSVHLVVPAPLVPAWSACLARFGIDAAVLTHDMLGGVEQSPVHPALLVVDEAHRFRNPSTSRWSALARWSVGRALLLITATPIWNREADLLTLLKLAFCDDVLAQEGHASIDLAFERSDERAIRSIVALTGLRRTEEVESVRFPREARTVARYDQRGRSEIVAAIRDLRFPLLAGDPSLLRSFLLSRLESSLSALLDSLGRQRRFCRRASESARNGFPMTRRSFDRLYKPDDGEYFQDLLFPGAFLEPGIEGSTDLGVLAAETERLDQLMAHVLSLEDDKLARLLELLQADLPAPVILFTRSRATAAAVHRALKAGGRCALVTSSAAYEAGGASSTMQEVLLQLRTRAIDVLVLTDLASEGLDLQTAGTVVHYDLPWTAVKMKQRAGRARRLGQARGDVRVVCFLPDRPGRSAMLPFIGRKHRLENRLLRADPVACASLPAAHRERLLASVGHRLMIAAGGAIRILEDGSETADPALIRTLLDQLAEPSYDPGFIEGELGARPPGRVTKGMRPGGFGSRLRNDAVLEALAVRNRSGVELLLAESVGLAAIANVAQAIAAEARVNRPG
ncbi:MAG: helicase-related protein [Thermoanaerobaculia bacterium]